MRHTIQRRDFLRGGIAMRTAPLPIPHELPIPDAMPAAVQTRLAAPPSSGLAPYNGPWTEAEVIHLLRRTGFGVVLADIPHFLGKGMQESVNELLNQPFTLPPPPVNDYNDTDYTDPDVAFGDTFINATYSLDAEGRRTESTRAWWIRQMMDRQRDVREKMTLFWHNHLAIQFYEIYFGAPLYRHVATLRAGALGNFKTLIRQITLDPAMLYYLNGYLNSKEAPDENYAREIQELFVIGKDLPQHFTEDDVRAAARLLTGWRTDGFITVFDQNDHDTDDKQFSAFYGNRVIKGRSGSDAGDQELDDFLDMLFAHPETARFICRKLYRFFVFHDIDAQTETNVIEPLAQIFRSNNYEILPVLNVLFKSEHFFDTLNRGAMIKSPIDFGIGMFREFGIALPGDSDPLDNYTLSLYWGYILSTLLQFPGEPPNVAGWQAYYQKPALDKIWINTGTLPRRGQITEYMIFLGMFGPNGSNAVIEPLKWAETLQNPSDVNDLIEESTRQLLGMPVSPLVKFFLKTVLLSELPAEYYWTDAWNAWKANPGDEMLRGVVLTRLRGYLWVLFQKEEFHLM
jgi:uncharacterized protein (DUF1800 family)